LSYSIFFNRHVPGAGYAMFFKYLVVG